MDMIRLPKGSGLVKLDLPIKGMIKVALNGAAATVDIGTFSPGLVFQPPSDIVVATLDIDDNHNAYFGNWRKGNNSIKPQNAGATLALTGTEHTSQYSPLRARCQKWLPLGLVTPNQLCTFDIQNSLILGQGPLLNGIETFDGWVADCWMVADNVCGMTNPPNECNPQGQLIVPRWVLDAFGFIDIGPKTLEKLGVAGSCACGTDDSKIVIG